MKVLLLNFSAHVKGSTYVGLKEIADTLIAEGIEAEIMQIGGMVKGGCKGCGYCKKAGKCVIDDILNEVLDPIKAADGYIFGSPVHFAGVSGDACAFMDRLFYVAMRDLRYKPASSVVVARRAGTTAALDQLNKYLSFNQMPIVSSQYWNGFHGAVAEEVSKDLEGMQTMRTLGRNMAWMLKCIALGQEHGIVPSSPEQHVSTNFIQS